MNDFSNHTIRKTATVIEALKQLNELPTTLTLFVLDEADRLVGTLTDGDIRRGFIKGLTTNNTVDEFMQRTFQVVRSGFSVSDFRQIKQKGIRLLPVVDNEGHIEKVYDLRLQQSILPVSCMIMAGGRGERLRPLTDTTPKPMLPLGGKPIIEHTIDRLITYGITTFYISVKYLGQQIMDYLGDGSAKGVTIRYVCEETPLGTAGALSLVDSFETDHILLMNSDLFTNADIEELYLAALESEAWAAVATVPYSTKIPYGIFTTTNQFITGLKEKPVYTHYANAGIYMIDKRALHYLPKNQFYNITDLLEDLLAKELPVVHNPIVGYWIDIGQYQDYVNAQEIVKHFRHD